MKVNITYEAAIPTSYELKEGVAILQDQEITMPKNEAPYEYEDYDWAIPRKFEYRLLTKSRQVQHMGKNVKITYHAVRTGVDVPVDVYATLGWLQIQRLHWMFKKFRIQHWETQKWLIGLLVVIILALLAIKYTNA